MYLALMAAHNFTQRDSQHVVVSADWLWRLDRPSQQQRQEQKLNNAEGGQRLDMREKLVSGSPQAVIMKSWQE